MTYNFTKRTLIKGAITTGLTTGIMFIANSSAFAQDTGLSFIDDVEINFFNRTRYESVDQEGFDNNAAAFTTKNRLSLTSGKQTGLQAGIEGEAITRIGGNFNDTLNGNSMYPVVADPNEVELNQAWVSLDGVNGFVFKIGRQRINYDSQRFVGGVAWRQNEQTYDALRVTNTAIENLKIDYSYIIQVNRIFGDDHPVGKFDGDSHLFNVNYTVSEMLKLTTYAYLLDLENALANSSATYGVNLGGKAKISNKLSMTYLAEYALQKDYKDNPLDYNVSYYNANVGISNGAINAAVGYEVLGGNGQKGFATPLATLHKFNGFADAFLSTPVNGLKDLNATVSYTWKDIGMMKSLKLQAWYHDYNSNSGPSTSYGNETDIQLAATFDKGFSAGAKFAHFKGDGFTSDRDKIWIWAQFAY